MSRLISIGAVGAIAAAVTLFAVPGFAEPASPSEPSPEGPAPRTTDPAVPPAPDIGQPEGPAPRARDAAVPPALDPGQPAGPRLRPASVLTTVKLRSGPGTTYDVLDVIPTGMTVRVANCSAGWCATIWKGKRGFATSGALKIGAAGPIGAYTPNSGPGYMAAPSGYYGYYGYYGGPYYWGQVHTGVGDGPVAAGAAAGE
jgi:hypothetical protein